MILRDFAQDNLDKANWEFLSDNPNAISLLEQNMNKVDWHYYQTIQMLFVC